MPGVKVGVVWGLSIDVGGEGQGAISVSMSRDVCFFQRSLCMDSKGASTG